MMLMLSALLCGIVAYLSGAERDGDWPAPNGPLGNHSVVDPELGTDWTGAQGKVAWRFPKTAPKGKEEFAGCQVSIAQGLVFIVDRSADQTKAILRAIGLNNGHEQWNFAWNIPDIAKTRESRPFGAPAASEKRVFLAGPEGSTLRAVDLATHAQIWTADFQNIGLSTSGMAGPQVADDLVVMVAMNERRDDVVAAFDGSSGALRWQTKMPNTGGFRTRTQNAPVVVSIHGIRQIVVHHMSGVAGLTLSGNVLWNWDGYKRGTLVAAPSVSPDGYIFVCSGHEGDPALGHVTYRDGKWSAETVFIGASDKAKRIYPPGREDEFAANREKFPLPRGNWFTTGAAWWDGCFYIEGMICMRADGLSLWRDGCAIPVAHGSAVRGSGTGEFPVTVVNGRLFTLSQAGDLIIGAADPVGFREVGRVPMGAPSTMLLAYSRGRIVNHSVRTGEVVCIDLGVLNMSRTQ